MPNLELIGRWMVAAGAGMIVLGGLLWLAGHFLPPGKDFPGTLRVQWAGISCVFPLLASILVSILLTVVLNLLARFLNR